MTNSFFRRVGRSGKDMGEKFSIVATNGAEAGLVLVLVDFEHDLAAPRGFLGIGLYPILCVWRDDGSTNLGAEFRQHHTGCIVVGDRYYCRRLSDHC